MKALAIYSIIVLSVSMLACLEELFQGIDVSYNLWGIAIFIPVMIYIVKTLQDAKANKDK